MCIDHVIVIMRHGNLYICARSKSDHVVFCSSLLLHTRLGGTDRTCVPANMSWLLPQSRHSDADSCGLMPWAGGGPGCWWFLQLRTFVEAWKTLLGLPDAEHILSWWSGPTPLLPYLWKLYFIFHRSFILFSLKSCFSECPCSCWCKLMLVTVLKNIYFFITPVSSSN